MKKALTLFAASLVLVACNKEDNVDQFCNAVAIKDWETVEKALISEAPSYTDTSWQKNAINLCKTLSEKDCIDTAFAPYPSANSSSALETEVVIWYSVADSSIKRVEQLYINSYGVLTLKRKY